MKYLISPSQQIGDYWANQMQLQRSEYKVLSRAEQVRGQKLKASEIIYIEGKAFDYPQLQGIDGGRKYDKLIEELKHRIVMDI